MARLMSVALTEGAVRRREKTVTRRLGWWIDRRGRRLVLPGDMLTLCPKVMGRKPGEELVRITDVEVVSVRREQLDAITAADVAYEGFMHYNRAQFIAFFCQHMKCTPDTEVTRIEWHYLDGSEPVDERMAGVQ